METILQSVLDVVGVGAAMVFDGGGRMVAHRGRSVYDRALCEQLGPVIVKAVDTIQLQHEDWDAITAQYEDGRLLVRNLGAGAGSPHVLAVVADTTLNPSFATVALRVACNKLRKALEGGAASMVGSSVAPAASAPPPAPGPAGDSRPMLASSGVAWSRSGSSVGLSGITVADPASGAWLSRCSKELARHVGPMAKVYVEEAVRKICPDGMFALASAPKVVEELASQIEDTDDRAGFKKALAKG